MVPVSECVYEMEIPQYVRVSMGIHREYPLCNAIFWELPENLSVAWIRTGSRLNRRTAYRYCKLCTISVQYDAQQLQWSKLVRYVVTYHSPALGSEHSKRVQFSLCLTTHCSMQAYGEWSTDPQRFLGMNSQIHAPAALAPEEWDSRYSLGWR
jgi:hypothetical protein